MDRRRFLSTAASVTAGSLLPGFAERAFAQQKASQIVEMTWGGQWGDLIKQSVDAAFEKETGVKVIQDRGSAPGERITKIKLNANDQKFDTVQLVDSMVPLAVAQGAYEPLNKSSPRLTNLKNVADRFVQSHWVAMCYSPLGIIYNTKLVKDPPKAFADLWRPEFKNRVVLPDIAHSIGPYIIPIGSMASGKGPTDETAGFEMLKKMVALQPIWAKDTDSIMNAMRNEEALVGLLYKSQTYTVKGWNAPVEWVYPAEGAIEYATGTGIAKGTKNLELAEIYLNFTIDPKIQAAVAEKFNYAGSNKETEALLSPELQKRVHLSAEEMKNLLVLDQVTLSAKRGEWTDRWNRIVSAG